MWRLNGLSSIGKLLVAYMIAMFMLEVTRSSKMELIASGLVYPLLIAILSILLGEIINSKEMYINFKLYNYHKMEKIIDAKKESSFRVFTDGEKIEKDFVFFEIENTGSVLISEIEIVINRDNPKNDIFYDIKTPILPGKKEYIAIKCGDEESVKDIFAITYARNADKLQYFSNVQHTDNFTYYREHTNKKPSYCHRKKKRPRIELIYWKIISNSSSFLC